MTKEDIIEQNPILVQLIGNHGVGAYQLIGKAMDEYAKQQSSSFVKWMDVGAVRNGDNIWQWRGDNFRVDYTTEQLYEKFIEQQNKE